VIRLIHLFQVLIRDCQEQRRPGIRPEPLRIAQPINGVVVVPLLQVALAEQQHIVSALWIARNDFFE
jgi:hypothetical protein